MTRHSNSPEFIRGFLGLLTSGGYEKEAALRIYRRFYASDLSKCADHLCDDLIKEAYQPGTFSSPTSAWRSMVPVDIPAMKPMQFGEDVLGKLRGAQSTTDKTLKGLSTEEQGKAFEPIIRNQNINRKDLRQSYQDQFAQEGEMNAPLAYMGREALWNNPLMQGARWLRNQWGQATTSAGNALKGVGNSLMGYQAFQPSKFTPGHLTRNVNFQAPNATAQGWKARQDAIKKTTGLAPEQYDELQKYRSTANQLRLDPNDPKTIERVNAHLRNAAEGRGGGMGGYLGPNLYLP